MGIAFRRISRKKGLVTEYFFGLISEYALPRRSLGSAVKNCTHTRMSMCICWDGVMDDRMIRLH